MAHLTLVVQGREVRKFVLNPSVTTIGRAQDNDIVINNLALSRRHAEVHLRRGRFEVEDLGSQNGVFVNNTRIRGPQALRHEDTITLGTYQFVFFDESPAAPPPSRRPNRAKEVTQLESPEELSRAGDLGPEPIPLLVLKYNDVELQRFPIRDAEVVVGRAKDCDIQIAERRLSRRHCKVFLESDAYYLTDLGSQNGTYVNRRRIPQYYELQDGDVLNFAEYAILFLADAAEYDGPDKDERRGPRPPEARPSSGIEREETEFPEAFAEDMGYEDAAQPSIVPREGDVRPRPHTQDPDAQVAAPPIAMVRERIAPDPSEPFVERPVRARERRKKQSKRDIQERRPARDDRPTRPPPRRRPDDDAADDRRAERPSDRPRRGAPTAGRGRAEAPPARRPERAKPPERRLEEEHRDVDDEHYDPHPDAGLDDWYDAREDSSAYSEEPSVLLERSKSSMSQILSTMMVDKRELDSNLASKVKQRRFHVLVTARDRTIFEGPLKEDVTILGTEAESDIRLEGRYVAGRHSLLVQVRDSLLLVRLGSSSAARVNGLPKLQAFLKDGDVIQIDETKIVVREP